MGIQIIKRKAGKMPEKSAIDNTNTHVQVSYNSHGHLAVRYINIYNHDEDILIVFDERTSYAIKAFCQNSLR